MVLKVEKEKMQTSGHGNDEGFTLAEAVVSLFIAGTLLLAIIGFASLSVRYTNRILQETDIYIQAQNEYSKKAVKNDL